MNTVALHQPTSTTQLATKQDTQEALKLLERFISPQQLSVLVEAMHGEEKIYFSQRVSDLAERISNMPVTYQTDGLGQNGLAYLHYFAANFDWYITEKDVMVEQLQTFKLSDMGVPELGYISINELLANNAAMDLYWTPKALRDIAGSCP